MRSANEKCAKVLRGALSGGVKGCAGGALASIATGAAVITTAPAWLPWIGGASAVALGTVGMWSAAGACIGAVTGGTTRWWQYNRDVRVFAESFPELFKRQGGRDA